MLPADLRMSLLLKPSYSQFCTTQLLPEKTEIHFLAEVSIRSHVIINSDQNSKNSDWAIKMLNSLPKPNFEISGPGQILPPSLTAELNQMVDMSFLIV